MQRKLIPLNIVVVVLCLVAALSILFLPLLSINVNNVGELIQTIAAEQSGGTDGTTDGTSGEGGSASTENDPMAAMLGNISFSVSVSGTDLATMCFSEEGLGVLFDKLGAAVGEHAGTLTANMLLMMMDGSAQPDEQTVKEIADAVAQLEAAKEEAATDAALIKLAEKVGAATKTDVSEVKDALREMYDETVSENDGTFTAEAFLCIMFSNQMNSSEQGSGTVYTNFSDLLSGMIGQNSEGGGNPLDEVPAGVLIGVGVAILFFAGVWVILLLFALFRIFAKNKRFTMWYVKLFGFTPCLIFGVLPALLPVLLPMFLSAEAAAQMSMIGMVLGMISSLSWISGACYILLWLVSIFWAFPIKRKIRKFKRELKKEA